jgi:hypothetical protein
MVSFRTPHTHTCALLVADQTLHVLAPTHLLPVVLVLPLFAEAGQQTTYPSHHLGHNDTPFALLGLLDLHVLLLVAGLLHSEMPHVGLLAARLPVLQQKQYTHASNCV